jgi:nucleoside 2-deoxyribosyltransferase
MLYGTVPYDPGTLFRANVAAIDASSAVVAILDQADPDSGTCWECGYAFARGKPVIGVRTDIRAGGDDPSLPVNLMLSQSCTHAIVLPFEKRDDVQ